MGEIVNSEHVQPFEGPAADLAQAGDEDDSTSSCTQSTAGEDREPEASGSDFRACCVFSVVIMVAAAVSFNFYATESKWINDILRESLPSNPSATMRKDLSFPSISALHGAGRSDITPAGNETAAHLVDLQDVIQMVAYQRRQESNKVQAASPAEPQRTRGNLSSADLDRQTRLWAAQATKAINSVELEEAQQSRGIGRPCKSNVDCPRGGNMVCYRRRGSQAGACRCTVMGSGSASCTAKPKAMESWCILHLQDRSLLRVAMLKERKADATRQAMRSARLLAPGGKDLAQRADWSTCAVVASSSSMLRKNQGAEIDRHSAIIRFNDAPTKGFEKQVGSKTTLRIQNVERCGFAERRGEMCIQYTQAHGCRNPALRQSGSSSCDWLKPSQRLVDYTLWYWEVTKPRGANRNELLKLSTGFLGISIALHLCGQVDIYGFESREGHYFQRDREARTAFAARHSWQQERQCINQLRSARTLRQLVTFH